MSGRKHRSGNLKRGKHILFAAEFSKKEPPADPITVHGHWKRDDPVSAPLAIQLLEKVPTVEKPAAGRRRVVIVGAGFAGIAAARALRRSDADVVLIDRRNHNIFQPLLYQVATAVLAAPDIAAPVRQLVARQANLSVTLAEVTGINPDSRTIDVCCPRIGFRKIPFDFLVVGIGVRPSYFGHDEFALYAPSLKNLSDAETIRAKILSAFEAAESTDDKAERARQMTFVLVGAGPTGVELAASMAHMVAHTLRGNFRQIDPAQSTIILIEAGNRILPSFAETLSKKAARRLQKLGVKVETGVKVDRVDRRWDRNSKRDSPVDCGGCGIADREDARLQDRSSGSDTCRPIYECSRSARRIRHRRYGIRHAKRSTRAWCCAGGDPARTVRGAADFRSAQGPGAQTSVSIF
jgi:NADPH-dependent 2,4-dienoyl-CoA reductase/sulfur reductase-like enzyme